MFTFTLKRASESSPEWRLDRFSRKMSGYGSHLLGLFTEEELKEIRDKINAAFPEEKDESTDHSRD